MPVNGIGNIHVEPGKEWQEYAPRQRWEHERVNEAGDDVGTINPEQAFLVAEKLVDVRVGNPGTEEGDGAGKCYRLDVVPWSCIPAHELQEEIHHQREQRARHNQLEHVLPQLLFPEFVEEIARGQVEADE